MIEGVNLCLCGSGADGRERMFKLAGELFGLQARQPFHPASVIPKMPSASDVLKPGSRAMAPGRTFIMTIVLA